MLTIRSGEHGSTFGGSPLGCAVAMAALDVLIDEDLSERAAILGKHLKSKLEGLKTIGMDDSGKGGLVSEVRCKGLMCSFVFDKDKSVKGRGAWDVCLLMASKGVLAKPTHENV